jgi:hypothetical protein
MVALIFITPAMLPVLGLCNNRTVIAEIMRERSRRIVNASLTD